MSSKEAKLSSGSNERQGRYHIVGALRSGNDGKLYVTNGDLWNFAADVQSCSRMMKTFAQQGWHDPPDIRFTRAGRIGTTIRVGLRNPVKDPLPGNCRFTSDRRCNDGPQR